VHHLVAAVEDGLGVEAVAGASARTSAGRSSAFEGMQA
jgi:hypothetical protein